MTTEDRTTTRHELQEIHNTLGSILLALERAEERAEELGPFSARVRCTVAIQELGRHVHTARSSVLEAAAELELLEDVHDGPREDELEGPAPEYTGGQ